MIISELITKYEKEMATANRLKHFAADDFTKGCESERVLTISNFLDDLKKLTLPHVIKSLPSKLHECPICKQEAGKTYLAARLPTICQNCDHIWLRG